MFESFLERKKAFPDYKKNKSKKVENLEFSYMGKIAQQNVFESIVKRKQVFPDMVLVSISFLSRTLFNIISCVILTNNNKEKKIELLGKPWVNLQKM